MELGESKKYNLEIFAREFYGFTSAVGGTKHSPKLKHGGDYIVIKRQDDGNYTFWSPTAQKKGSIVDFVIWRDHCDAKQAIAKINEVLQGHVAAVKAGTARPMPELAKKKNFDRSKLDDMMPVNEHSYLESRGISILSHGRFRDTVFTDEQHHNAVFPHRNGAGEVVGYTLKNAGFTGFSPGGVKTIWSSNQFANDNRLIVCEASIDALSYAELMFRRNYDDFFHSRFVSTDGGFGPETENALEKEIKALPENAVVVAAFDKDDQGWKFVGQLFLICEAAGREMKVDMPRVAGYDWNEVLQKFLARENEAKKNSEDESCAMTM